MLEVRQYIQPSSKPTAKAWGICAGLAWIRAKKRAERRMATHALEN